MVMTIKDQVVEVFIYLWRRVLFRGWVKRKNIYLYCQLRQNTLPRRWKHGTTIAEADTYGLWVVSIHGWQIKCNPKLLEVWFITQDTCHQCSCKLVKEETMSREHASMKNQLTDIFKKALDSKRFGYLQAMMGMCFI